MLTAGASYTYANAAAEKYPRFVCRIDFETPLYLTSHPDITGIDGEIIHNVLTVKVAKSIRIIPDEGRSEIGVVDFQVLDLQSAFTQALFNKIANLEGLRGKKVTLYHGFRGAAFSQFVVFQTQKVQKAEFLFSVYSIRCADITREQRVDIFDPKKTRLAASISETSTTIDVVSTQAFEMVEHGASYSDAPGDTVGYIQIEQEIIRYTGKTDTSFTGCERGVLNTRRVPHTVDLTAAADRRTEVRELIYLELPIPKLILALNTGVLYGQSGATLPAHWHMGIEDEWIRTADFTDIGSDLWDTEDDDGSFVAVFIGPKKTDGKRFLEKELYQLIGCYPIVYSDGTLGIRRMNRILADAPFVAVLDDDNCKSWSSLEFDMSAVHNQYSVDWNHVDGTATRRTIFVDGQSLVTNGSATPISLAFQGLYGSRHTDATVRAMIASMRDRYASPPARQTVEAMPRMNYLEVGDIVRNRLPHVRDYFTGELIDRSMEIQRTSINRATGDAEFELFGSTGLASTDPSSDGGGEGPGGAYNIPDDWYSSQGVDLGTVADMTEDDGIFTTDAGTFDVEGDDDLAEGAAIFYVLGDLVIHADTLLLLSRNVHLRVMGFLTINGAVEGVGGGLAGVADTSGYGTSTIGSMGFGTSRAMNGLQQQGNVKGYTWLNLASKTTRGKINQIPAYSIDVYAGSPPLMTGLPRDLRGTGGGPGGKIQSAGPGGTERHVRSLGGTGAAGGAGLVITCRGLAFGGSGVINLSGADSATPTQIEYLDRELMPGAGAPGMPGGFLLLIDGNDVSLPDISGGKFIAAAGASGAPLLNTMTSESGGRKPFTIDDDEQAWEGFADPAMTNGQNLANSAYRIQYAPAIQTPDVDQPAAVPPPDDLAVSNFAPGIYVSFTPPPLDLIDGIEIWRSTTNDRTAAAKRATVKASYYIDSGAAATTYYYWIRSIKGALWSIWEPTGSTSGVSVTTP